MFGFRKTFGEVIRSFALFAGNMMYLGIYLNKHDKDKFVFGGNNQDEWQFVPCTHINTHTPTVEKWRSKIQTCPNSGPRL